MLKFQLLGYNVKFHRYRYSFNEGEENEQWESLPRTPVPKNTQTTFESKCLTVTNGSELPEPGPWSWFISTMVWLYLWTSFSLFQPLHPFPFPTTSTSFSSTSLKGGSTFKEAQTSFSKDTDRTPLITFCDISNQIN
jgi:hypothetical protein